VRPSQERGRAGGLARQAKRQQQIASLPAESEEGFQNRVIVYARLMRWRTFHPWTSIHSPSGFPDLVMVRWPRCIFAELKSATGRFTPDQIAWLDELAKCPAVEVYRWRPADWPEVEHVLRGSA
jgi:hypothetical protein